MKKGTKKMKTKLYKNRIIALILIVIMSISAFSACGQVVAEGTVTVVICDPDTDEMTAYTVGLSKVEDKSEGALSIIRYLISEKNLSADIASGSYGAYINSIGSIVPDTTKNECIEIYTSVKKDFAVPSEWQPTVPTVDYNGKTLSSSGLGISSMTVEDGTVILFKVSSY